MNRVGRLLICIAGGVALSVAAHADVAPAPPVVPKVTPLRQNTNLMNRLMMMKKQHHSQDVSPGFSQFAKPFLPQSGVPQANVSPSHGDTVAAVPGDHPGTATAAVSSGNPYESIVTRNVFGLNPIPPYVAPPAPEGPPPPKITLTGITTIFGPAQALFKVAGVVRNGRAQDESYIFTEGEEQDDVTVTKIDVPKQTVTFKNHGVEQVVPLTDGVASSGPAPAAPAWPGQNGPRTFRRFRGLGGTPGFQPQGQPQSYNSYNPSYNNQSGNNFGGSSSQNNSAYNPSAQAVNAGLSGEDEAALIAAQHAQMLNDPNPKYDPMILPPTPFDKEAGVPVPEPPVPSAQR